MEKEATAQSNGELNLLRRRVAELEQVEAKSRQIEEKLRLEQDFNATLIQSVPLFFVVIDADGKTLMMNEAMLQSLGYTADEVVDKDYLTIFVPERDRAALSRVFTTLVASHEPTLNKNHVLTKGGRELLVEWHGRQVFKEDGALDFFFGAGVDITETKRAERRIGYLNRVLRAVRNVNQLIVHEKDRDALIQRACELLIETRGYHNAWIALFDESGVLVTGAQAGLGKTFTPLIEKLDRGELIACGQRALAQWEIVATEDPPSTCSDCPLAMNYAGWGALTTRLEHEGKVYGLVSASVPRESIAGEEEQGLFKEVASDIAFALHNIDTEEERKNTEEELEATRERLELAMDAGEHGFWDWNLDTNDVYFSPRWYTMLGYESGELPMRLETWIDLMHPEDRETIVPRVQEYVKNAQPYEVEFRLRTKGGGWCWISGRGKAFEKDAQGNPHRALGVHVDITERKRAEEERLALEAQLRQSQKLESIGTLASGVAHEINNPLTGIINYADLIESRVKDDRLREFAAGIMKEGNRVAKIVKDLLSFARQEKQSHSPARIEDIINTSLTLVGGVLRKDQITIEKEIPDDLPQIRCRSQQIEQVIINLLTNARDALNQRYKGYDEDKLVRIQVKPFEKDGVQWIRMTVEDHGVGVPENVIERIFDPFFTTKPRDAGTGLGLSVSYGIIKDHHGELTVESKLGKYTRFHLDLRVDNG